MKIDSVDRINSHVDLKGSLLIHANLNIGIAVKPTVCLIS